jgi:hypothetical protein
MICSSRFPVFGRVTQPGISCAEHRSGFARGSTGLSRQGHEPKPPDHPSKLSTLVDPLPLASSA